MRPIMKMALVMCAALGGVCATECVLKRTSATTPAPGDHAASMVDGWLCCPAAEARPEISADCCALHGAAAEGLTERDVDTLVRLVETVVGTASAASEPARPPIMRSFQNLAAVSPSAIERVDGVRRSLQASDSRGARYLDRRSYHGNRRVLVVTMGTTITKSGQRQELPPCSGLGCMDNPPIRNVMWGDPGSGDVVGASPWSIDPACQNETGTGECLYNVRDAVSAMSRGAITLDEEGSHELYLAEVGGWPDDNCEWSTIWNAISAAVAAR
jgi:hypothetical protein